MAEKRLKKKFLDDVLAGKVHPVRKDGTPASKQVFVDGGGLLLVVGAVKAKGRGSASWVFRYQVGGAPANGGRRLDIGLGPLADDKDGTKARAKAAAHRDTLAAGGQPMKAMAVRAKAATGLTFRQAADMRYEKMRLEGKSRKHLIDWTGVMNTWVFPIIGNMDVRDIDTEHVEAVMMQVIDNEDDQHHGKPFWLAKHVTAKKALGKIYQALQIAILRKARATNNPASYRRNLDVLLPAPNHTVTNQESLHYDALPGFMVRLKDQPGMGALALRFLILTASRTGPVREATWAQIDLQARTWTVEASGMKVKSAEHRVPLCDAAMEILDVLRALPGYDTSPDALVFPSSRPGSPLSNMTLTAVVRRMGDPCVPHGFRATWASYLATETDHDDILIEHALHHRVGTKVAQSYRRTDMMERRRALFDDFGRYACGDDPV